MNSTNLLQEQTLHVKPYLRRWIGEAIEYLKTGGQSARDGADRLQQVADKIDRVLANAHGDGPVALTTAEDRLVRKAINDYFLEVDQKAQRMRAWLSGK